ncbi:sensor histidine kinase [Pedobacter sp. JY14-1]|uniref:sensor histidine kinase n=1 Tax=Pedobacter sp. JY14-1 TaxID=3034151 RepID=UPI0023E1873F|nr:sensor histidine kinase [Pedobacter sp. JY14-1]
MQPEDPFDNADLPDQLMVAQQRIALLLQEISRMAEQHRIALVVSQMHAQEAERKRIADSLHNGLGQLLYGVQLNLNRLNVKPGQVWSEEHNEIQKYITGLVKKAIKASRRISHELMPAVLEDFGLKAAVEDIGRQFNDFIPIQFDFSYLPARGEQHIEVAIYRTVQELVTNVVKHAQAKKICISMGFRNDTYYISVSDDGIGFDVSHKAEGIGLKTIREKVAVLKGSFQVSSLPGKTIIDITIPNLKAP